jgi:O-antigen/teichoic acid export membrane protein
MSEYRLFAQRIGLTGITNLLVSLSGIILLPILTKTLSIEEYGIWAQIIVTIGLIPSIVLLGLPYTMVRFLAGAKRIEEIQEGYYSIYTIVLFASSAVSLLLFSSSRIIASTLFDGNQTVVKILSIILFIECLNNVQLNFFRTSQQMKKYSSFLLIQTCLNIALVACFVLSGHGIAGAAIGILVSRFLVFLIMVSLIVSEIGIKIPKFTNLRDYLVFGLPTVPGNLSRWVVNSSDRYVIGILLGTAFVGYYSPGYTLGYAIYMFVAPLGIILPAILSKYYDEHKMKEAKMVLKYSLKYFLLLAIPSSFGLSLLSEPLLEMLSTSAIAREGYLVTPFVAVGTVFFGASVIVNHVVIMEKKTAIMGSIYTLAAILNLGLSLVLVPYTGIVGAAIATLVAYLFVFIVGIYYSFKYLRFEIDLLFILKSIFASIAMSLVIVIWSPEGLSNLMIAIGVCALIYATVLLLLRGMTKEELLFFKRLLWA